MSCDVSYVMLCSVMSHGLATTQHLRVKFLQKTKASESSSIRHRISASRLGRRWRAGARRCGGRSRDRRRLRRAPTRLRRCRRRRRCRFRHRRHRRCRRRCCRRCRRKCRPRPCPKPPVSGMPHRVVPRSAARNDRHVHRYERASHTRIFRMLRQIGKQAMGRAT